MKRIFTRQYMAGHYPTLLKWMDETPRRSVLAPHISDAEYNPVACAFMIREGFDPTLGFAVHQGDMGEVIVYQG